MQSGRPKVCYYQPKNNNFKGKNQQENLIAIFLSQLNLDEHVSTIINTFKIYKGGLGASPRPQEQNIFFFKKNQSKWSLFLIFILFYSFYYYFFFAFWQGSLDPQNYELAP